jgi:hypothetical protein
MLTLKILAAAAAVVSTPAVAVDLGVIGPGSDRGLQPYGYDDRYHPSYNFGYYPSCCDGGATAQRYRSYDPVSGTYVGHDGRRSLSVKSWNQRGEF